MEMVDSILPDDSLLFVYGTERRGRLSIPVLFSSSILNREKRHKENKHVDI